MVGTCWVYHDEDDDDNDDNGDDDDNDDGDNGDDDDNLWVFVHLRGIYCSQCNILSSSSHPALATWRLSKFVKEIVGAGDGGGDGEHTALAAFQSSPQIVKEIDDDETLTMLSIVVKSLILIII